MNTGVNAMHAARENAGNAAGQLCRQHAGPTPRSPPTRSRQQRRRSRRRRRAEPPSTAAVQADRLATCTPATGAGATRAAWSATDRAHGRGSASWIGMKQPAARQHRRLAEISRRIRAGRRSCREDRGDDRGSERDRDHDPPGVSFDRRARPLRDRPRSIARAARDSHHMRCR